jgi:hypothetical protein
MDEEIAIASNGGTESLDETLEQETASRIVAFLRKIGLEVRTSKIAGATFLPGIRPDRGVLVFDPAKLRFPGDLLHEAGHLAVKPATEPGHQSSDLGDDPAEEMMAIAWSYAAAVHLQLPLEVLFHAEGYRGGSQSLIDNFAAGRYLAVPMLQWLGMTYDDKRAKEAGVDPYPNMVKWLRDSN